MKHTKMSFSLLLLILLAKNAVSSERIRDILSYDINDGSGEVDQAKEVIFPLGKGEAERNRLVENKKQEDIVDKFLSIVEEYEHNKKDCKPGTEFNLGEGVVAQYGLQRFKSQALVAVTRANLLTRLWKGPDRDLLLSEYNLYAMVRSMVEGDQDLFAAGNCHDYKQYKNYELFCPYAHRVPEDFSQITVKDLSVEYKYLGNESEFFLRPRQKAAAKLSQPYNISIGMHNVNLVSVV